MNKNIWDKLDITKDSPNVLKLLNEQAELLSEKTKGMLIAEVNPVDTYDEKSFELGIVYNFYTQVSEVIASPNFMPENQCIKA